jgi:glycosyltransferase involved in cell wall biosynthesis
MKILYLTQNFPPEPGTTRTYEQALSLVKLNHEVTVVTTMPYYPSGRIHNGYRGRLCLKQKTEGLTLIRIWSFPAANRGRFLRIISHLSFGIMAQFTGIILKRHDLVISRVPNIGTDLAGIVIAFLKRSKLLLELEDVIPDNLAMLGISDKSDFSRLLSIYYKVIYRLVDVIAVIGSGPKQVLIEKGVKPDRILIWPNAARKKEENDDKILTLPKNLKPEGRFVVMYSGSFSSYYDIPNIINAAEILQDMNPTVIFMLTGSGFEWEAVRKSIADKKIQNVILAGIVPQSELSSYFMIADIFLNSLAGKSIPKCYHNHFSAKICEYLMEGKPVISIENGPVCGDILREIGAGFPVPAGNPGALAERISYFAENRDETIQSGNRAKEYAVTNLDRQIVAEKFLNELTQRLKLISSIIQSS